MSPSTSIVRIQPRRIVRRLGPKGIGQALVLLVLVAAAAVMIGLSLRQRTAEGASLIKAAAPVTIAGVASVIDGDTIEIRGERIRLNGIDAPESGQKCLDPQGGFYRCGAAAANALDAWINGNPVSCEPTGKDRYDRTLATCSVRSEDINGWMVRTGHALAYRQYSMAYVREEDAAKAAGDGVWRGRTVAPWEWRKGARLPGEKPTKAMIEGKVARVDTSAQN